MAFKSNKVILSMLKYNNTSKNMLLSFGISISKLNQFQLLKHCHQTFQQETIIKGLPSCRCFHINVLNSANEKENKSLQMEEGNEDKSLIKDIAESLLDIPGNNLQKFEDISVKRNVLAPVDDNENELVDFIAPQIRPTFNLAAYADMSDVLKNLIQLGVNISEWDKHKDISSNIIMKDFEKDIKPYVFFIHNLGVPVDGIGRWITKNPFIFDHSFENIQSRIDFLKENNFTDENISRIVVVAPRWINFSHLTIDKRLGYIQKRFKLSNKKVVELAVHDPKLILDNITIPFVLEKQFRMMEDHMGFSLEEQKILLLKRPRLYRTPPEEILGRFNIIHNEMGLSHETIVEFPGILVMRERKLRERIAFLKFIGKNQFDRTKPGYISPLSFCKGSDAEFCTNVAASSVDLYNDFLKTL